MAAVIITEHLLYGLRYSSHGFLPLNAGSRYLDISPFALPILLQTMKESEDVPCPTEMEKPNSQVHNF